MKKRTKKKVVMGTALVAVLALAVFFAASHLGSKTAPLFGKDFPAVDDRAFTAVGMGKEEAAELLGLTDQMWEKGDHVRHMHTATTTLYRPDRFWSDAYWCGEIQNTVFDFSQTGSLDEVRAPFSFPNDENAAGKMKGYLEAFTAQFGEPTGMYYTPDNQDGTYAADPIWFSDDAAGHIDDFGEMDQLVYLFGQTGVVSGKSKHAELCFYHTMHPEEVWCNFTLTRGDGMHP